MYLMKTLYVYPLNIMWIQKKKLNAFKKKYPHLIDRFSISNSELLFTISFEREISTQNWTINFLESNVNQGRNTNEEGSALSTEFYKDLFNLFDDQGNVYFENGDIECALATVGAFDCQYLFKLVEGGIEWREED